MKKRTIWKNIILIASAWIIIIAATLAWFVFGRTGTVDELKLNVGEASFVQISGDGGGSWSDSIDIEIGVNKVLKEMSGNGIELFTPVYEVVEKPTGGFVPTITAFKTVQDKTYYYEQVFDFRTDSDYNLYLSPQSYVSAVRETEDAQIVGAIRVGFYDLDEEGNEELLYIWAPNSQIEFSQATGAFNMEGSPEAYYYYQTTETPVDMSTLEGDEENPNVVKIPATVQEGSNSCSGCGYNAEHKFMWSCGKHLPEDAPQLLEFKLGDQQVAEKRIKIKMWLEGYDRECVSQTSGQRFTMHFEFHAEKENIDE